MEIHGLSLVKIWSVSYRKLSRRRGVYRRDVFPCIQSRYEEVVKSVKFSMIDECDEIHERTSSLVHERQAIVVSL